MSGFGKFKLSNGVRMARRSIIALATATVLVFGSVHAQAQQVAGTVEGGLAQLARAIADRSKAAERTTIAVLPFPHADGACSVLSTYVVDELILTLFQQSDAQLEIIERSQLEAIISELAMGEGGLLNPATTKELGSVSGVSALTLGTITVIGDIIRLNARLVATDTGRTISAAATTIPKTAALTTLLGKPATCATAGQGKRARNNGTPPQPAQQVSAQQSGTHQADTTVAPVMVGDVKVELASVSRSEDKKTVGIALWTTNTGKETKEIIWVRPAPTIVSNAAQTMAAAGIAGQHQCHDYNNWFDKSPKHCGNNEGIYLVQNTPSVVKFQFREWKDGTGDEKIDGSIIHFVGTLLVKGDDPVTFSIRNIPIQ